MAAELRETTRQRGRRPETALGEREGREQKRKKRDKVEGGRGGGKNVTSVVGEGAGHVELLASHFRPRRGR